MKRVDDSAADNTTQGHSPTTKREGAENKLKYPSYGQATPRNLSELDVSHSLITDLMLRHLRIHGVSTFSSLTNQMKLSTSIVKALFEEMRKQQWIEVKGTDGLDYSFGLTTAGRTLAAERSQTCNYTGPAPVSLNEYSRAVKAQAAKVKINRAGLRAAFSDLIISDSFLDRLGPALISQQSLFLYGPTGNGKTSYSERLLRIYDDSIILPYAVEVDGQIVIVYDPGIHNRLPGDPRHLDPRWVVCQRPCITAGGELTAASLDLRFDGNSGAYVAPLQMRANNGILIIDDFGRQTMTPRELLNRWILPLDRRVDYLTLSYGLKFQIPFELLVVFSTNLDPSELMDMAFLRRIPNKVYVGDIDDETFDRIFEVETAKQNIACGPGGAELLRKLCKLHGGNELRACYPVDICRILVWIGEYENRPAVEATHGALERAVGLYFAQRTGYAPGGEMAG